MLAKLMKYEIKATARWFLPLYVTILIFALLNKFIFINPLVNNPQIYSSNSFASIIRGIISSLSMFVYVLLFLGIFVTTLIVVIQRFYKSLLGDEGYLMFTLPVKSWQHILNKLLVSMLWHFASSLVALCSILILIPELDLTEISYVFGQIKELIGISGIIIIILFVSLAIIMSILKIYCAISLGHLFNKYKLLLSFGMYLGIDTITQLVTLIIIVLVSRLTYVATISHVLEFKYILVTAAFVTALFAAGYFALTSYLIKRKLNLE